MASIGSCLNSKASEQFKDQYTYAYLNLPSVSYWKMPAGATMRDVILVVRADEAHHRLVNHTLGSMDLDSENPFKPGQ